MLRPGRLSHSPKMKGKWTLTSTMQVTPVLPDGWRGGSLVPLRPAGLSPQDPQPGCQQLLANSRWKNNCFGPELLEGPQELPSLCPTNAKEAQLQEPG